MRNVIGVLFLPWAILGYEFVCLMPSMGELENRAAKLLLCETWPFTWEFWQLWSGRLNLASGEASQLQEAIARISRRDALEQRVVLKIMNHEQLDHAR